MMDREKKYIYIYFTPAYIYISGCLFLRVDDSNGSLSDSVALLVGGSDCLVSVGSDGSLNDSDGSRDS